MSHLSTFGTVSAIENLRYYNTANSVDRLRVLTAPRENAMKRAALCFATVAFLAACTNSAQASDLTKFLRSAFGTNHHSYHHAAHHAHIDHHLELQARAIEREAVHYAAHQHPLTTRQHARLHHGLDRAVYHDTVEHHRAHATRAYSPVYAPSYRSVPDGHGTPYRYSAYGPYSYPSQVVCSPYGRY